MCEYCGCQEFAAIAQLTSEHDEIRAVARDASLASRADDRQAAAVAAARLLELLEPHTAVEERGLFAAMAGEFGEHVASLESDHRRIEAALEEIAAGPQLLLGWTKRLDAAVAELFEHILREQDGLFPAALSVLTPRQWDELDQVRVEVTARPRTPAR
jgi:hemerythrin-like domain-containing protein